MALILYLRPVGEARVLDPGTNPPTPLPPEGKAVEDSPFWRRRLRAKEVEKTTAGMILVGRDARRAREGLEAQAATLAQPTSPTQTADGDTGKKTKPGKE